MKPTVYLETTIFGYLAMRTSRMLRTAANQHITRDWWDNYRQNYESYCSGFVIDECSAGDPVAAAERLVFLKDVPILDAPVEVETLSQALYAGVPMPPQARIDVMHISVAAVNGIEYLMTWNCKHIANAALQRKITDICRGLGYEPPVICMPPELMELNDEP